MTSKSIAVGDKFVDAIYNDFPHTVKEIRWKRQEPSYYGPAELEYLIYYDEDGSWEWQSQEQMERKSKRAVNE